jgi:hypothetical protein
MTSRGFEWEMIGRGSRGGGHGVGGGNHLVPNGEVYVMTTTGAETPPGHLISNGAGKDGRVVTLKPQPKQF